MTTAASSTVTAPKKWWEDDPNVEYNKDCKPEMITGSNGSN